MGHHHNLKDAAYRALRQRIDEHAIGLPDDAMVYDLLRLLFSEQDAALAARLPLTPTSVGTIARRLGMAEAELAPRLERMADNGLVFDLIDDRKGCTYYMLAPPVVGFVEFSMMRHRPDGRDREVAEAIDRCAQESREFPHWLGDYPTPLFRALVHEDTIAGGDRTEVLSYERATALIEESNGGALSLCHCRHVAEHLGRPCSHPTGNCTTLFEAAEWAVRHGMARRASRGELLDVLAEARGRGLVQLGDNVQNQPTFICHCCSCCCGILTGIQKGRLEHAVSTSNFIATVDPDHCAGCGRCARRCPVGAIWLEKVGPPSPAPRRPDLRAVVDGDLCLGCGVCPAACKKDALRMAARPQRTLTPENTLDRVLTMAIERGKLGGLLFGDPTSWTHVTLGRLTNAMLRVDVAKRALLIPQVKSRFLDKALRARSRP